MMKIVSWIILAIIILIVLGLLYYLLVGEILFHYVFSKKTLNARLFKKNLDQMIKEHKIDLCWWDKVDFEKVKIKSFDNLTLVGHYCNLNSLKTVIIVHGFGGSYRETQPYCKLFYEKNFNILAVDNRAHGESEGNCVGFGWLDRKDIISWINYLNEKTPNNKIVLFGVSMGGTAVCCVAGEEPPSNVESIISDSAFARADKQIEFVMKKKKLNFKLLRIHLFDYVKRSQDFDVSQVDAVKQVKKTQIPILFIHGKDDDYVPVEDALVLYNATPQNLKDKFIVENAKHAMAYAVTGNLYEKKISDFLKSYTKI